MESSRESNQCGASYSFMKKTSSHVYMLYFCIYTCLERNMLQLLNLYIYIFEYNVHLQFFVQHFLQWIDYGVGLCPVGKSISKIAS